MPPHKSAGLRASSVEQCTSEISLPHSLAARLRLETRDAHERVELAFDLTAAAARVDTYLAGLCKLKCAYLGIKLALERLSLDVSREAKREVQMRIDSLEDDIRSFNVPQPPYPIVNFILEDSHEALGCEYVMRGSALGGLVIFRLAAANLGITQQRGGKFFYGDGSATRQNWSSFRDNLAVLHLDDIDAHRTVSGAIKTFKHFEKALAVVLS